MYCCRKSNFNFLAWLVDSPCLSRIVSDGDPGHRSRRMEKIAINFERKKKKLLIVLIGYHLSWSCPGERLSVRSRS